MSARKCWAFMRPWSDDCDMRIFRKSSLAKATKMICRCESTPEGDTYCMVVGPRASIPDGMDYERIGEYDWDERPWPGTSLRTFAEEFSDLAPKKFQDI